QHRRRQYRGGARRPHAAGLRQSGRVEEVIAFPGADPGPRLFRGESGAPELRRIVRFAHAAPRPGAQGRYSAVQPPSSTSAEPVINEEASLARNTMAPVRSSICPRRPSLILPSTSSRNALFSKNGFVIGVSRNVGPSELTRMLCGASSIAIALVKPSIACLEAQ